MAERQNIRLGDVGRKWETLNARRDVQGGWGTGVRKGKPAEGEKGRLRSGLGGKCGEVSIRVAEAQRTHAEGGEPSGV